MDLRAIARRGRSMFRRVNFRRSGKAVMDREWDLVITPDAGWFELHLADLWRYRDLIGLFVRRDFVAYYKQTILGPLWHIVQPLLTTLIFTLVFGRIAALPTDHIPPFIFYMSGTVMWSYFAACLTRTSTTFTANAYIFGKVYFPRLAVPLSVLLSNLVSFAIQFVFFLAFLVYFKMGGADLHPNGWLLATPFLLVIMAGIGLGSGIVVSSLTTRYRDLANLVAFGVQLLMFATPVVFPLSAVPDRYRFLIQMNPMTPVIETFRHAFLGAGAADWRHLLYSLGFMTALLFAGLLMFHRVERTFMDTV